MENRFINEAVNELDNITARVLQSRNIHKVILVVKSLKLWKKSLRFTLGVTDDKTVTFLSQLNHLPLFYTSVLQSFGYLNQLK